MRDLLGWIDRTVVLLITVGATDVLACMFGPEWAFRHLDGPQPGWVVLPAVLGLVLALLVPFALSVFALVQCAREGTSRGRRLARIITGYFAIIFSFAGLYYALALVGDYTDAMTKYEYYRDYEKLNKLKAQAYGVDSRPAIRSERAFNGMTERLFTGVDWQTEGSPRNWVEVPVPFMVKRASLPQEQVVRFVPESRGPVLLDCLHFSIVTSATVGYGDLSPSSRFAKLTADFQIVQGVLLLVIVLGMFFSGWWDRAKSEAGAAPPAAPQDSETHAPAPPP